VSSRDPGQHNPILDSTLLPTGQDVEASARAYVVRRCPDDFDHILTVLGLS